MYIQFQILEFLNNLKQEQNSIRDSLICVHCMLNTLL